MKKSALLEGLNQEQIQGVTQIQGPVLVVAGAGTGKTTVITRKLVYLIEQGLATSDEVLALTFTEKASIELEERLDILLPYGYFDLWASTFHSFCERILRLHAIDIGLPGNFKILSSTEQWIFLRKNLKSLNLKYYKPLGNPSKFLHELLRHFSRLKDEDISVADYVQYAQDLQLSSDNPDLPLDQEKERILEVAHAFQAYNQLLLDNSFLDFGDLIVYTIKLFKERPSILEKYRAQFKYILVDEFQDTNHAQYDLIKLLAQPQNNLTVVGDDEQSIYKFRGAALSNILEFRKDFPKAKAVVLRMNYRSYANILDLSYRFIQQNDPNRLEARFKNDPDFPINKELTAVNEGTAEIQVLQGQNRFQEAELVVQKILEIKENDPEADWNDFAILTRSNDAAQSFASALERMHIPHQFLAARGLYLKPVILTVINFFKLLDDYHESSAVSRVLMSPVFGLSAFALVGLTQYAKKKSISLYDAIEDRSLLRMAPQDIQVLERFISMVKKYSEVAKDKGASDVYLGFLEDSGYIEYVKKLDDQLARENMGYLNQFWDKIKRFEDTGAGNIHEFVDLLEWESEAGELGSLKFDTDSGPDMIKVMTVHGAKGLEFNYVFIGQVADKRFPAISRTDLIDIPDPLVREIVTEGDTHLEEERRLFYVAMTRAKKGLYFSWALDYGGSTRKKPSRFLMEMGMVAKDEEKEKETEPSFVFPTHEERNAGELRKESPYTPLLPHHISYSQIKAFETCPLQYKYANVFRILVRGKPAFTYGQTMHLTLQRFFEQMMLRESRTQGDLFGGALSKEEQGGLPVSLDEMKKIFEQSWSDDWLGEKDQHKIYYDKGIESLTIFYKKLEQEGLPKVASLERSFHFLLGGIKVIGKIDRVDTMENGLVRLVDYKTGSPKEKLATEDKQQLLMYQAAMEALGEKVGALCYHYLDDSTIQEFIGTPEEVEEIKKDIQQVVEAIRISDFTATPSSRICGNCDFKGICEFRAV